MEENSKILILLIIALSLLIIIHLVLRSLYKDVKRKLLLANQSIKELKQSLKDQKDYNEEFKSKVLTLEKHLIVVDNLRKTYQNLLNNRPAGLYNTVKRDTFQIQYNGKVTAKIRKDGKENDIKKTTEIELMYKVTEDLYIKESDLKKVLKTPIEKSGVLFTKSLFKPKIITQGKQV